MTSNVIFGRFRKIFSAMLNNRVIRLPAFKNCASHPKKKAGRMIPGSSTPSKFDTEPPKKLGLEDDVPIDHSQLKGFLVKFRGCNSYIFQQRSRRQVLKPRWALHCQRRRDRPSIGEWVAWRRILFFLVGRTEMTLMGTSQFKPPKMTTSLRIYM